MDEVMGLQIDLTEKQVVTLLLFAQNYSLPVISEKMGVCLTTTRERLKALSRNHSREFNNALGLRTVYKRTRDGIRDTTLFSSYSNPDGEVFLEYIEEKVQKKF